jgi:hypothetical protein
VARWPYDDGVSWTAFLIVTETYLTAEQRGRDRASADWDARKPRILVIGLLASKEPLLHKGCHFYHGSIDCEATDENRAFVAAYNRRVSELVATNGIPEWAPSRRRPSCEVAREMLETRGESIQKFKATRVERALLLTDSESWGQGVPVVVARAEAPELLIVGGNLAASTAAIHIWDAHDRCFMWAYLLRDSQF